ncbi:hypothetical protein JI721_09030 [Alicyclobacillus cycloheptanicus]|jgi:hypothetical protein|uniref:Chromosome segregation ATPase n=1 Tax=Alicyclobacillus cycloheptanicus TaxID=1457 RepID=A0ABT9XH60_9BACL|nr:hypothetical protein [Alicyclobacillus cycloheptanicus]MDQ0189615.1 chromosome segregation ATPase [Alicyclobacillus cycloheptanicus]WDL99924.1 hypothetical protein JI721_09030 [Alicyclobacillus cycloheptanicus]
MSKIGHYIAMIVTIGILADLMTTTFELARVDKGLNTSLRTTAQLVSIEQAVNQKNAALAGVLRTTKQMSSQIATLEQAAAATRRNIVSIDQLNADTLKLNTEQQAISTNSAQALGKVIGGLTSLEKATASLGQSVSALDKVIQQDRANLDALKADTDTMNRKTPGV